MNLFRNFLIMFFFVIMVIMSINSAPPRNVQQSPVREPASHKSSEVSWIECDKDGRTVILESERFDGDTISYFNHLKKLAPIYAASFISLVRDEWGVLLAQFDKNPAQMGEDERSFAGELKGHVDLGKTFEQALVDMLISNYDDSIAKAKKEGPGNTINFIVTVRETAGEGQRGAILGFIGFNKKQEYPKGSIEAEPSGIIPSAQGRGLFRFLMFSIFKTCPEIKRIFAHTQKTNINVQKALKKMGFVTCGEDENHIKFEYIKP